MVRRILLALALPVTALQAQNRIGQFTYVSSVDPITDKDRSYVWTGELHPTAIRNGRLIWRCDGTELELALLADEFLDDGPIPIVWRFDRKEPHQSQWNPSTNNTAAFASGRDLARFTAGALPATNVVVRATNYRGLEYTYEFSLAGLTASLRRLRCAHSTLAPPVEERPDERWSIRSSTGEEILLWREPTRSSERAVLEWRTDVIIVRDIATVSDQQMVSVEVISRVSARNGIQGWVMHQYLDRKMDEDSCFLKFVGVLAFMALRDKCIGR